MNNSHWSVLQKTIWIPAYWHLSFVSHLTLVGLFMKSANHNEDSEMLLVWSFLLIEHKDISTNLQFQELTRVLLNSDAALTQTHKSPSLSSIELYFIKNPSPSPNNNNNHLTALKHEQQPRGPCLYPWTPNTTEHTRTSEPIRSGEVQVLNKPVQVISARARIHGENSNITSIKTRVQSTHLSLWEHHAPNWQSGHAWNIEENVWVHSETSVSI